MDQRIQQIAEGTDTLAVVGLGYVGLPLAVAFGRRFPIVGFDIDGEVCSEVFRLSEARGIARPEAGDHHESCASVFGSCGRAQTSNAWPEYDNHVPRLGLGNLDCPPHTGAQGIEQGCDYRVKRVGHR